MIHTLLFMQCESCLFSQKESIQIQKLQNMMSVLMFGALEFALYVTVIIANIIIFKQVTKYFHQIFMLCICICSY